MTAILPVANTIAQQIGARAFMLMGTRRKLGTDNGLIFDIRGSQCGNKIVVTLDLTDTYTVTLYRVRGLFCRPIVQNWGIYADELRPVIEGMTGLHLSL